MSDIYIATGSAVVDNDGQPYVVQARVTTARAGHRILDAYPELFEPLVPTFETEQQSEQPTRRGRPPRPRDEQGNIVRDE